MDEQQVQTYLMENSDEDLRLTLKTDPGVVKRQAGWAGIGPGMRVLDVGCGSGITTAALAELVGENGHVTGLDFSEERLEIARQRYPSERITFVRHDIRKPYIDNKPFDAVWARFILEYFDSDQGEIVANSVASLKVGGIACLADLDNNGMGHDGHNERLQKTLDDILMRLQRDFNFDPYAGRRLYGHLKTLGFDRIDCRVEPHHLIYGELSERDSYNWMRKLEVTAVKSGCQFEEYSGAEFSRHESPYHAFVVEAMEYFTSPKRFCYTPLVICRGAKTMQDLT